MDADAGALRVEDDGVITQPAAETPRRPHPRAALGVAIGLCLAPFIIMSMALKVLAVGAVFSAFMRPRA